MPKAKLIPDAYIYRSGKTVVLQLVSKCARGVLNHYKQDEKGCIRFRGKQLEEDGRFEFALALLDLCKMHTVTMG